MVASPHFEQLLNPTNENAQNSPVGPSTAADLAIFPVISLNLLI